MKTREQKQKDLTALTEAVEQVQNRRWSSVSTN